MVGKTIARTASNRLLPELERAEGDVVTAGRLAQRTGCADQDPVLRASSRTTSSSSGSPSRSHQRSSHWWHEQKLTSVPSGKVSSI